MIKILHLTPSMEVGGTEKIVFEIISALKNRFNFFLASSGGIYAKHISKDILNFTLNKTNNPIKKVFIFIHILLIIKRIRPDIIHTHHRLFSFFICVISLFNKQFIHVHTMHNIFENRKILTSIIKPEITVAVGRDVYESLTTNFLYTPQECKIIKNGVHIPKKNKKKSKSYYKISCIGRLCTQKGQIYLIKAMYYLVNNYDINFKFKLHFYGDGPDLSILQKETNSLKLDKFIQFNGNELDIGTIFNTTDLVVSPSLWEGLPLVLLEALAYNIPVIATDIKGNNEIIIHKKTGFLVEAREIKKMAEAIWYAFTNADDMKKLSNNGYNTIRLNHSLSQMIFQYKTLYLECSNKNSNNRK